MENIVQKRCNGCGELKPLSAFSPDRRPWSDGYQGRCKACRMQYERARRAANPELMKRDAARLKRFKDRNRERVREMERTRRARKGDQMRATERAWAAKNRERVHAYRRKHLYGITQEQYNALLAAQDNRCAMCGEPFTRTPHIDHDHTTNAVRGILCHDCNPSLGVYEKIKDLAERYLARFTTTEARAA